MEKMTLKELNDYAGLLRGLQLEYEGKLSQGMEPSKRKRLTTVLNLIIEERNKVNRSKYEIVWNRSFVHKMYWQNILYDTREIYNKAGKALIF